MKGLLPGRGIQFIWAGSMLKSQRLNTQALEPIGPPS